MRAKSFLALTLALFIGAGGCTQKTGGENAASADGGRPPVAVEVAPVTPGEILDSIEVVGTLRPKFQAEVKTEHTGVVTEVYVTEWVRVRKGAPLARLDSREVEADVAAARAAVMQAGVATQRAEREYERAVKLKSAGLATQQSLDDARTEKDAAAAAQEAARARLQAVEARLAKTVIRAPMNGVVAERAVNVGDLVENMGNPPPMFRIVDNSLLELTLAVPSARLAVLRTGQPLTFETDGIPEKIFRGSVRHINPATEEVSRTARVIAEAPNASGELKAGMFAKGIIFTGKRSNVLQVPRLALLNWDVAKNVAAVFVVVNDTARRREVHTGTASGELVEITSGLTAGEMVVSGGAFNLRDADRVQLAPGKGE